MKTTLQLAAGAALCAAAVGAMAANVTVYGVLEEGILVQKAKHVNASTELKSAFDLGSRVGFKGAEDLGSGVKVGFILESGFSPDTGAYYNGTNGFTRESLLYLQGESFGRLGFGRTGTLGCGLQSYNMQTGYAFMNGYGLIGWDQNTNNFLRVNNAVAWQSPVMAGVDVGLMYSNGVSDDSGEWSDNQHYYGAALRYRGESLKTSLIFETKTEDKSTTASTPKRSKYVVNYGIEYDLGAVTPMFSYRYVSQADGVKAQKVGLSAVIPAGPGRFKAAVTYLWGHDYTVAEGSEDKIDCWQAGVAYEWALSKRTVVKPFVGYSKAGKAWSEDGVINVANVRNAWQGYVGLHHFF